MAGHDRPRATRDGETDAKSGASASDLLAGVLSSSSDAVVFLTSSGVLCRWNGTAEKLFGWTSKEMIGRAFDALVPREWAPHAQQLLRESEQQGRVRTLMSGVRKDGYRFYAEASSMPVRSSDGAIASFVTLVRDVSDQVLATVAASLGSDETAAIALDKVARAIRVLVPFDRVTLCAVDGPSFRRLASSGLDVEPRPVDDVRPLAGAPHEEAVRTRNTVAVDDGAGSYVVMPLFHDGVVVGTLDVFFASPGAATPVALAALHRVASIVTPALVNVLAYLRQTEALRRLEHLDELKNDFLALIMHDMRTPLAVVAAFAETLRDRWDDLAEAEKLESVGAILRNGQSLFRLVAQGLEIAMIESGDFVYEMASLDLGADLAKTVRDVSAREDNRPIRLAVDADILFVRADRDRHWQVITNLLSNAMKFSSPGSPIEVRATREGGVVRVAVRDRGVGIRPEDVVLLFRKGSRIGNGHEPGTQGTGLGLYICKSIVEAHGGHIWFEPTPGGGSTFSYTLPAAPDSRAKA